MGSDIYPYTIYFYSFEHAEVLVYVLCKNVIDLSMSRDRLLLTGCRIEVDVVICTMTMQKATCFPQSAD